MTKISWLKEKATALLSRTPAVDPPPVPPIKTDRPTDQDRSVPVRTVLKKPEAPPPIYPRRRRAAALDRFVEDMQGNGYIGEFGWRPLPTNPKRAGIYNYYQEHCAAERTTPLRPMSFARALGKHPAVEKYQVEAGTSTLTAYFIHDSIDRYWINHEGERDAERPPH